MYVRSLLRTRPVVVVENLSSYSSFLSIFLLRIPLILTANVSMGRDLVVVASFSRRLPPRSQSSSSSSTSRAWTHLSFMYLVQVYLSPTVVGFLHQLSSHSRLSPKSSSFFSSGIFFGVLLHRLCVHLIGNISPFHPNLTEL